MEAPPTGTDPFAALAPEALDDESARHSPPHATSPDGDATAVHVVCVVVAHDGEAWLATTLDHVRRQTRPVDHLVLADTGSLRAVTAPAGVQLLRLPRRTGFGRAVHAAVAAVPAADADGHAAAAQRGAMPTRRWLWLLHDDSAPDPAALELLLRAARRLDAAAVGPKVVDWDSGLLLREVGVSISRAGHRSTGLEPDEPDQGQRDDPHDVLAVGTAGLLIRHDVWDEIGGLDPLLALFRDDVDLGWRLRAAGHRVVVEPAARVRHVEAAGRGLRPVDASGLESTVLDRRNALLVLLLNAPGWRVIGATLSVLGWTVLRVVGFLLGRSPRLAWEEAAAAAAVLSRPEEIWRGRRRRREHATVPARALRRYFPSRGAALRESLDHVRLTLDDVGDVLAGRPLHHGPPEGTAAPLGATPDPPPAVPRWRRPGVVLAIVMVASALLGARALLGAGVLQGGALLPAPADVGEWWRRYTEAWHPVGLGSSLEAPATLPLLAALGAVLPGGGASAVDLLLLGAVPLAAGSAWLALRGLGLHPWWRAGIAAWVGVLPVATGAVAHGRLGTVVVAMAAPLLVRLTLRSIGVRPNSTQVTPWRHAVVAGVLLAAVSAFVPAVWLVAAASLLLLVPLVRGQLLGRAGRALLVLALPLGLLGPQLPRWIARPSEVAAEAGLPDPALPTPAPWATLLLSTTAPGAAPRGLLAAALLVAALTVMFCVDRRPPMTAAVLPLVAVLVALVLPRVALTMPGSERTVPAWPGPAIVLVGVGVGCVVALAVRGPRRPPTTALPAIGIVGLGLPVLVVLALWISSGTGAVAAAQTPLRRASPDILPAYITADLRSPDRPRAVVLRGTLADGVDVTTLRAGGPRLGDAELTPPADVAEELLATVSDVLAGREAIGVDGLARHAVRYVVLPAPIDPALVAQLDATPELARAGAPVGGAAWRVTRPSARAALAGISVTAGPVVTAVPSEEVQVDATLPGGLGEPLRLRLAEPADPRWVVTVDGRPAALDAAGPARQVAALAGEDTAAGAALDVAFVDPARQRLLLVQAAAVLLALLAAVPLPGPRVDVARPRRDRRR